MTCRTFSASIRSDAEILPDTIEAHEEKAAVSEPANHTLAYLRRLDEKLDRLGTEVGDLRTEVSDRLGRIEEELMVRNGIALRLEGREMETTGPEAILDRHERRLAKLESVPTD